MPHASSLSETRPDAETFVTIGVFDGFHLGHQSLIRRLVNGAKQAGCQSAVLTFHPHPDKLLKAVAERYYLTSPEQRAELMLQAGVDLVITLPFDEALRRLPAADFVNQLFRHLRVKELWVGADFALGFRREGDVAFLKAQGARHGFAVKAIPLIKSDKHAGLIASSRIRALINGGDAAAAKALLGRAYSLAGEVAEGERRGRTIGIPTANISAWAEQLVPANGVYAAWAILGGERFMAAANIGQRPTFAGEAVTIEAHLLGFNRDIYGERLELRFEKRLRPERKFASLNELVAQIRSDIKATRLLLG